MPSPRPAQLLLVAALLVTWLVWGSSFVAISWALEAMPPLLLMATRFVAAGAVAVLAGWLLARRAGHARPTFAAWRDQAIVGFGFVVVGMGATSWAATRLPSAITALLVATAPLWIVLLQLAASRGRSANVVALAGVAVGTAGVAALVSPGGTQVDALAAGTLVLANAIWAGTTLFATRAARPEGLLLGVGMQMLLGGAMLGVLALAIGEGAAWNVHAIDALAAGSWAYLVLAASLGGFVAYGWLLRHASASLASTHAFVNPLVAVALGALLLGETIDARVLAAGGAVIAAVVLLLLAERRVPAATSVAAAQPEPARARRAARLAAARAARMPLGRGGGRRPGWTPAPTPSFARRASRPWQATDGMDALAIDAALDRIS